MNSCPSGRYLTSKRQSNKSSQREEVGVGSSHRAGSKNVLSISAHGGGLTHAVGKFIGFVCVWVGKLGPMLKPIVRTVGPYV